MLRVIKAGYYMEYQQSILNDGRLHYIEWLKSNR